MCSRCLESGFHMLWVCSSLKDLRLAVNGWANIVNLPKMLVIEFLGTARDSLRIEEFELLCVGFWRVWFWRNRAIHGQLMCPAGEIANWAASFLHNFQQVQGASVGGSSGCLGDATCPDIFEASVSATGASVASYPLL
ncbi:hypothetical protein ACOSQ2_020552 [Xanthoceras sorbifolium]